MIGYWRDTARPIIAKVLTDNAGKSPAEIRKALRDAYPFGPKQYHPYKIWLDEIARQTGRKATPPRMGPQRRIIAEVPGQEKLF